MKCSLKSCTIFFFFFSKHFDGTGYRHNFKLINVEQSAAEAINQKGKEHNLPLTSHQQLLLAGFLMESPENKQESCSRAKEDLILESNFFSAHAEKKPAWAET